APSRSGSFAILAAMRRASSRVSRFAACVGPAVTRIDVGQCLPVVITDDETHGVRFFDVPWRWEAASRSCHSGTIERAIRKRASALSKTRSLRLHRIRWQFNVAIAVGLSDAHIKSVELTIAIVPAGTSRHRESHSSGEVDWSGRISI